MLEYESINLILFFFPLSGLSCFMARLIFCASRSFQYESVSRLATWTLLRVN